MRKKRLTDENKVYDSEILKALQAFENIGTVEEFETLKNGVKKQAVCLYRKNEGVYAADDLTLKILKEIKFKKSLTFTAIGALAMVNRKKVSAMFDGESGARILWHKLGKALDVDFEFID